MFTTKKINLLHLLSESSKYVFDIYSKEKIQKVNKIIKNKIFNFQSEITPEVNVSVEYCFRINGVKKMISVGEYYDYLTVDIEVVGGDERFDLWMKIAPVFLNNYQMLRYFSKSISEKLQYFFGSNYVRVDIPK
jgi:hypothetical protein